MYKNLLLICIFALLAGCGSTKIEQEPTSQNNQNVINEEAKTSVNLPEKQSLNSNNQMYLANLNRNSFYIKEAPYIPGDITSSTSIKSQITSTPVFSNNSLFFGTQNGVFYAFDFITNVIEWEFKTLGSIQSSPAIAGETIIFGSNDNYLYALNKKDGTLKWLFKTGAAITSSPAVYENKVYFGSQDKKIYCLELNSGKKIWEYETTGQINSSPIIDSNYKTLVIGSNDGSLYSLYLENGADNWIYNGLYPITNSPVLGTNQIYITVSDKEALNSSYLIAINPKTGTQSFKQEFVLSSIFTPAINIEDNILYLAGNVEPDLIDMDPYGVFYAINPEDGKSFWDITIEQGISTMPSAAGFMAYVGTKNNTLTAINSQTQEVFWTFDLKTFPTTNILIVGSTFVFGGNDQNIYIIQ